MDKKEQVPLRIIAHIENDFAEKFGIPRQSGLAQHVKSFLVFEPEYRNPDAFRGIEEYSHLWLLWHFSETDREGDWTPTVRPPRLGGNTRVGVFATRSPFRPNPIGLSCVRLEEVLYDANKGPVLVVSGADLMNGTPVFDVKPYLAYVDSQPEASNGFALAQKEAVLKVEIEANLLERIPEEKRESLLEVLGQDPRPQYQKDAGRIYKMTFGAFQVHFRVEEETLKVTDII